MPLASARLIALVLVASASLTAPASGQTDAGRLTLDRLAHGEFQTKTYGPIRWANGAAYTILEPSAVSTSTSRTPAR